MIWDEIEIPKEIRDFMLEGAEETVLGEKNGSKKQYRYGNLHIREYDDKYLVHVDKVDPRRDPLGHLVHDARDGRQRPGSVAGVFGGTGHGRGQEKVARGPAIQRDDGAGRTPLVQQPWYRSVG